MNEEETRHMMIVFSEKFTLLKSLFVMLADSLAERDLIKAEMVRKISKIIEIPSLDEVTRAYMQEFVTSLEQTGMKSEDYESLFYSSSQKKKGLN